MRTWCSEEYIGLALTSDFQVQIWVQTFLLHFMIKRLWEHEEYQALHKLHGLGLTISCRSPIPSIVFMIILSLELRESPMWMPQSTHVGRSQEGQTHHTWRYHNPANYNWLMKTQLIRALLEKQTTAQLVKKFAKFYRIQRLITVYFSTLLKHDTAWLKT